MALACSEGACEALSAMMGVDEAINDTRFDFDASSVSATVGAGTAGSQSAFDLNACVNARVFVLVLVCWCSIDVLSALTGLG